MSHPVVHSDSDSEDQLSDTGAVHGENEDISTIKDPKRLREIIRQMQLEKNTRESTSRSHLTDVTNLSDLQKRKRKKKKKDVGTTRKRPRVSREPRSPAPSSDAQLDSDEHCSDSDSSDDDAHADGDDDRTKIKRAGHLFVMNWGLWVKGNTHIFEEAFDPAYDEKQRFETTANKIQGQLRDIEKVLPDGYRGEKTKLGKAWVARAFMSGASLQRGNTSTRLRKVAGASIFDCSPADLLLSDVRREKFREQIGWYVKEGTSGAYSCLDVPILHDGWNGEYDIATCFLNRTLMRLYVAIIRGPSAATAMLQQLRVGGGSDVVVTIQSGDNMERIHGIDHTEPGAIAGSAVLAIWALSADTCLRSRDDHTNIDYDALFDQYLEILLVGLRNKVRSILNVFREWDRIVFPNSEFSLGSGNVQNNASDGGNQKALEAMRAEGEADRDEEG
ncbi:hypothetical protein MVEN_01457900 [Mycena venus]|uniref:Uncharacterized protein n=1 Tax=Mycena venus TaxID=2733690 RepID=A0A8H6XTR8_9AGAR|nr:hypothetical protein MVEN_01457900 [Mycena venus]